MITNYMNKKRKGTVAVSWIVLLPLMFMIMMVCIFSLFMFLTNVNYSNVASSMSQDLNMRQTGYEDRVAVNNQIITGIDNVGNYETEQVTVITSSNNENLKQAVNYQINKQRNRFSMPWSEIESIEAHVYKNSSTGSLIEITNFEDIGMAGAIVIININYKYLGMNFVSTGYNVIS